MPFFVRIPMGPISFMTRLGGGQRRQSAPRGGCLLLLAKAFVWLFVAAVVLALVRELGWLILAGAVVALIVYVWRYVRRQRAAERDDQHERP